MAERRRRGWTGFIVGLIVVLALLWVGYWFAARYAAQAALARAAAGDNGIACTNPAIAGFPLTIEIRCDRLAYGSSIAAAELGNVSASAPLFLPGSVEVTIGAPLAVNAPDLGLALTASWSLATATASAWLSGLTGAGASFTSLTADNAAAVPALRLRNLSAATASGAIEPAAGGAFTLSADAAELRLLRSDGFALPQADAGARITLLDVGDTLGTDPAGTIRAWLRGTPSARIDRLRLSAVGAIVSAEGMLNISADGRLNGSILLRWNDIARLADLIEAILPGSRARTETPLQGLNAVSVAVDTPDGPMRQTTLTFTQGVIWLGIFPLPVDPIPPIRF